MALDGLAGSTATASHTMRLFIITSLLQVSSVKADADPVAFQVAPIYPSPEATTEQMTTKTVQGFLDYVTTVGNTVIFFTQDGGKSASKVEASSVLLLPTEADEKPVISVEADLPAASDISQIQPTAVVSQPPSSAASNQGKDDRTNDDILKAKAMHGKAEETMPTTTIDPAEEDLERARDSTNTLKNRSRVSERTSAISSFKERLKKRFEEAKQDGNEGQTQDKPTRRTAKTSARASSEESFFAIDEDSVQQADRSRRFKSAPKSSGQRGGSSRSLNLDGDDTEWADDLDAFTEDSGAEETTSSGGSSRAGYGRSAPGFGGTRRRQVSSSSGSSSSSSRGQSTLAQQQTSSGRSSSFSQRNKVRESLRESLDNRRSDGPKVSLPPKGLGSGFTPRDRQSSRLASSVGDLEDIRPATGKKVVSSAASSPSSSSPTTFGKKPKIEFKKFDRFERPDIRKNLLNKFLKNRPAGEGNDTATTQNSTGGAGEEGTSDENGDEALEEFPDDHESSPSALVPSIINDEDLLQHLEHLPKVDELERLQTTLVVSTHFPRKDSSEEFLEVATIRSPYTFDIENSQKSTRFITVTRTFSKSADEASTSSASSSLISSTPPASVATASIAPTKSFSKKGSSSSKPLFDTKSIPAPVNILATTAPRYTDIISGSSDIETLPPVTLSTGVQQATSPPLKTVTETLSTEEMMIKRSILPVIMGTHTSYYTLSQSYTVTRLVTAVKTIPPMELYEFSPPSSFTDFDALFEGAGSENREQLLPGELEFSDQDNFGLDGPAQIRVSPPPEFLDDLDLIGAKLDFVDHMEKDNNPEIFQLKNQNTGPKLEPSFLEPVSTTGLRSDSNTPSLSASGLAGISPEQLLYLQLLQNPLAALGLGGAIQPQVVTDSTPILKTETVFETNTIRLFLGAKEFFTTLTTAVGVTTKTDYRLSTRTVGPGLGLAGIGVDRIDSAPPSANLGGLAGLLPAFTLVSSPVVKNTVITETNTQEIRIIFRNVPTLTKITSTTLVSTKVTSYVTKTQKIAATVNPLAGLLG